MEADDVFDTVSGSLGLTGAADTILIMKRQAGAVTLHVRGRDIEETEKALQFDKQACRWSILGAAADVYRSAERNRVLVALQGGQKQAKELMLDAELRNRNAADILLHKMVKDGEIVRAERGLYGLPGKDSGKIGKKERSEAKAFEIKDENGNLPIFPIFPGVEGRQIGTTTPTCLRFVAPLSGPPPRVRRWVIGPRSAQPATAWTISPHDRPPITTFLGSRMARAPVHIPAARRDQGG